MSDDRLSAHLGLVHHVARQLIRTLSVNAELDELVSSGMLGLLAAVRGFDPARGLAFSTYAAPRIRGAILDDLRKQDRVPRSVRRKERTLRAAEAAVASREHRAATEAELAEALGVPLADVQRWRLQVAGAVHVPIDRGPEDTDPEVIFPEDWLPASTPSPEDDAIMADDLDHLRTALAALTWRDRQVVRLYYFENMTMQDIATQLDLTESRICQLHARVLRTLRSTLAPKLRGAA